MSGVIEINSVPYGSTGKVTSELKELCKKNGIAVKIANRYREIGTDKTDFFISSWLDCHIHNRIARYTGLGGCFSHIKTFLFLKKVKKYNPDIIHLHNIHGNYLNLYLLFKFIKRYKIKTFWTLHDCWAFTGHCPHFTIIKCDKWKTGCYSCPQYRQYPQSYVDRAKTMYKLKKKWFCGVENMTIITPSQWLAGLVKQSYLKDYSVKVIYNGIDLSIFKPTESDFRKKYNIEDKLIVLGVAFGWGERKGLDVFVELSKRLDDRYQIVLVGTDDNVDKQLPENIISIHRTENQAELAEIYTAADVFANPTREEVLGLVNIEALACGTPVVTFNSGGSPECIDETCGRVVTCDDIDAFEKEIKDICENKIFSQEVCLERAKHFDMNDKFKEYVNLYEEYKS